MGDPRYDFCAEVAKIHPKAKCSVCDTDLCNKEPYYEEDDDTCSSGGDEGGECNNGHVTSVEIFKFTLILISCIL